ncbi:dipeptide epimerase [Sphingosinicella sp. BN140058]|uniref:dipeptide epimerase n=1 Tax=Sphingosinicella sp. BN140058 TaxID=1892855 RepID=UPI001010BC4B|nr:dipeptide epimerase [Sphingosinicella sp. BN140058]QAY78000.1 dipeptide epimerase [Sphingosinicella sp. BN140058]
MPRRALEVRSERLRLAAPFRISGYVFESAQVIVATLTEDDHLGRGEAAGVYYTGDDAAHIIDTIEAHRSALESGVDRHALQALMPPGGARNAIDCALWELEARRTGRPAWWIAGIEERRPLVTTFTLGADDPAVMAEGARDYATAKAIKVKLTGELELDLARVKAIRAARPDVWLGVDANQGFGRDTLDSLVAGLLDADVALLEQPLRRGREADLEGFASPIPIAADESVLTLDDIERLVGRFQVANIKLDKCGGLTEGLAMAARARELGLGVMVGNMVGTSLAMAPAFLLGQQCDVVDLDGPTFLERDRQPSVRYQDGTIWCDEAVWGAGAMQTA